ncbi:ATP-binding protein [Actinokineospora sp. NBRC 105648]|uniref:ATP-binding protein n=1 Tax=Actinokineospora sp. NBRC 105648 TaxID=3032206 RepID=UPI00249FE944|nr:ATP-binding protein [Actinokineospora sp. NBRC 105648]GLZ38883.1 histidine kinase [Actinokineospora sp. NBRC 105648]
MVDSTGNARRRAGPAAGEPAPCAVIEMTGAGVVSGWNPAAALLYGYRAEEVVGTPIDVLFLPTDRVKEAALRRRISAGGPAEGHETERVRKDGTRVWVSSVAESTKHPMGGGVTSMSWETRGQHHPDPAEAPRGAGEPAEATSDPARCDDRETQERKEWSQAQAQRLESLGQLAGGVAHDFNNLLAVIVNYVAFVAEEVAAAGPDPAGHLAVASADLTQIEKAAERAVRLTHQLLVFARRDVIRPQVLDLDTVITTVEEMLRQTLGEHIHLVTTLAPDLWPVLADPGQLEQVLVNLAVNARDAMPEGGTLTIDTGNVTVDAETIAGGSKARQGRNVRLRVSDSGTGMPAEVAQRAFEPFFTTKSDNGGTGLGLATVYGILTQADGTIRIYSEPGTGTTFTIMLPATAAAAAPIVEPVPYQRAPKGETVLVVEDEAALREVTRRIFTRNGYTVITAANGPEALDIAARHPGEIHLLVTDVVMPHLLGKEVAERMRLIRPGIEVIFMSGYARPVLASQGRLEPGVALVAKPFSEADLIAMAGRVLNGHFRGFAAVQGQAPA